MAQEDGRQDVAFSIHRNLGRNQSDDMMARFKAGEFPIAVSVNMFCLDDQTEILTSDGFVGIDEMDERYSVANWWEDGSVTFQQPKGIIRRTVSDEEKMVVSSSRSMNIRVTGNHTMVSRCPGSKNWTARRADEIVGMKREFPAGGTAEPFDVEVRQPMPKTDQQRRRAIIANSCVLRRKGASYNDSIITASARYDERHSMRYAQPRELSEDECRLIGFWIGDGSRNRLKTGGVCYSFSQSEKYTKIIGWLDAIFDRLGLSVRKYRYKVNGSPHHVAIWTLGRGTGFGVQKRRGLFRLEPYLNKNGTPLLWGLNEHQFDALVHGYWMADGTHGEGCTPPRRQLVFRDTNRKWIDLLQSIACCRGYRANQSMAPQPNPGHRMQYELRLKKTKTFRITHNLLEEDAPVKQERVWCVTTDSGFIIVRRGGRVMVVGNSKGFDFDKVNMVIMVRRTKSLRLYTQAAGRGTRPLRDIRAALHAAPEAAARRKIIDESDKAS
jgi:hypothetical protein